MSVPCAVASQWVFLQEKYLSLIFKLFSAWGRRLLHLFAGSVLCAGGLPKQ